MHRSTRALACALTVTALTPAVASADSGALDAGERKVIRKTVRQDCRAGGRVVAPITVKGLGSNWFDAWCVRRVGSSEETWRYRGNVIPPKPHVVVIQGKVLVTSVPA